MRYIALLLCLFGVAFETKQWLFICCLALVFLGVLLVYTKQEIPFQKIVLKPAKMILNFSFFACGFLCLKSFNNVCPTCIQNFTASINGVYDTSFWGVVKGHMRFFVLFGLAVLWFFAMLFYTKKRKKC